MKICVLPGGENQFIFAETLSKELEFVFFPEIIESINWRKAIKRLSTLLIPFHAALIVEDKGLSLLPLFEEGKTISGMAPIYIDFTNTEWARRLFNISSKNELAAKALGLHKNDEHRVFDANAGLGQDSFVFAALGAEVLACERSPLVYCLLSDALQRARQDNGIGLIAKRIKLIKDDAISRISNGEVGECHSIYLDPMFPNKNQFPNKKQSPDKNQSPNKKRQALSKKEMQVFQKIIGSDQDAELLFDEALNFLYSNTTQNQYCKRVVLKRPRLAPVLLQEKLGRQIEGNATRFDIYFKS